MTEEVDVEIRPGLLTAASLSRTAGGYAVLVNDEPVPRGRAQSISDHEVGTHLLRMMNDEDQAALLSLACSMLSLQA